jgi:hypothetical protein
MISEIDNHIGRGGSLADFSYYDDCGAGIIDVHEYREDELTYSFWEPAMRLCKVHTKNDPYRDVRVATHQLVQEIRGRTGNLNKQRKNK